MVATTELPGNLGDQRPTSRLLVRVTLKYSRDNPEQAYLNSTFLILDALGVSISKMTFCTAKAIESKNHRCRVVSEKGFQIRLAAFTCL
jgi:hypothetical protein